MSTLFKRAQTETFWSPVEIEYTTENGAKGTAKFEAQFKRLPDDEWEAYRDRIRDQSLDDKEVVREVMVGWKLKDDDGAWAEFNEENLQQVFKLGFASAIVVNFFRNFPKAKQKN